MSKSNVFSLLLVVIAFCVFLNAIPNGFVYDDIGVIEENYFIKSFRNLPKIFSKEYFTLSHELSYRPVVTLSYFLDYAVWGLNPFGYHLSNVAIHAFNVLLFCILLNYLVKSRSIAFFSALIFSIHPCGTEAVNAISYREDLFVAGFSFLSCIFLIKSLKICSKDKPLPADDSFYLKKGFFLIIGLLFYLLALFSKESAIVLPVFIVLYWLLCGIPYLKRYYVKILLGYALVTFFFIFVRFFLLKNPRLVSVAYYEKSFWISGMTMVKVVAYYVKQMFLPIHLNADYKAIPVRMPSDLSFLISVFLLVVVGVVIFKIIKHSRLQGLFALCFFVALLPVMNIIPIGHIMAERYLYLPVAGFCGVTGCVTGRWFSRNIPVVIVLAAVVVISFTIRTVLRNNDWLDEYTFWTKIAKEQPGNHDAHNNLGVFYYKQGDLDRAIGELEKAVLLKNDYPEGHNSLGTMYIDKGLTDKAISEFSLAIHYDPASSYAYYNMGNAYFDKNALDECIVFFNKAIQLNMHKPQVFNNLGSAYLKKGNLDAAIAQYRKALSIYPDYAEAHSNLGFIYTETNRFEEALNELKKALRLNPDHANAHNNLGALYCRQGLWDLAEREFLSSIRANPRNIGARKNLGIIYFQRGKMQEAREQILHVLKDDINHVNEPGFFSIAEQLGLIKK
ncbi:tetratricopeptide repeat protein [Candidatus Kuenenia sp.]|uniref:tetratricopeptide repeat protein n=1 Tax=Candidatus Kuenenia sp. TaxID=2499824 RepID=UPI00321FE390